MQGGLESDEEDLRILWPLCQFSNAAEALDYLESAYPSETIKPRTQYIVEGIAATTRLGDSRPHSAGGAVWVRPHARQGRPVSGHWRRPR